MRYEYLGWQTGQSRVTRETSGGVARRGTGYRLRANLHCMGDAHGAGSVLERSRGIATIVLKHQLLQPEFRGQSRRIDDRSPPHLPVVGHCIWRQRQQFRIPPLISRPV